MIISDALEMRAVSEPFGLPEVAVLAVAAGTDLLCFGRDQDRAAYLAVRDALAAAVASGRMPAARLEDAAARVADLRAWTALGPAATSRPRDSPCILTRLQPDQAATPGEPAPRRSDSADGADVGLAAARRAVRVTGGPARPLRRPVLVEVVPPANIAVGDVPWGLEPWVPADSIVRLGVGARPRRAGRRRPTRRSRPRRGGRWWSWSATRTGTRRPATL